MAESTLIDYNFGRAGNTARTYINNEKFRAIDYIEGWKNANTKIKTDGEKIYDLVKGKGNYIRTCLETASNTNTINYRANFFPFCLSGDKTVMSIPSAGRTLPPLPKFDNNGRPIENPTDAMPGAKVGFQNYICPKIKGAQWPQDYWTLTETKSNSAWPIRPSNGDGSYIDYSPPKPYHARIRIRLTDLKWVMKDRAAGVQYMSVRNILEDESVELSDVNRTNGDIVELVTVRGFINLVNPDGINATTNSSGHYQWPHNFNQIHYRVTTDPYGGDDDTPTITVFNAECAGDANIGTTSYQNQSSYYGAGVPFEVPVLFGQQYLIFDVYTDVCDRKDLQISPATQWWQLTWSFESCMYRPVTNAGNLPVFHIDTNPELIPIKVVTTTGWPRENYYYTWLITHGLNNKNISLTLYKLNELDGSPIRVFADFTIIDSDTIAIKIRGYNDTTRIPNGQYKVFLIAGNAV